MQALTSSTYCFIPLYIRGSRSLSGREGGALPNGLVGTAASIYLKKDNKFAKVIAEKSPNAEWSGNTSNFLTKMDKIYALFQP